MSEKSYCDKIKNDFFVNEPSLFRFGSIGDGGYYLKPDTIKKCELLFSGGISSNLEFEYDIFRFNQHLKIVMIDPTVSGLKLVLKGLVRFLLKKPEKIRYLFNALMFNFLVKQKRCKHLKLWLKSPQRIFTLIKQSFGVCKNILIKLDIEGSEYDFLDEIVEHQSHIKAMVFEFHDMHIHHQNVYDFIKKCSPQFNLTHLNINPSGGYNTEKQPKCIEISLERKE